MHRPRPPFSLSLPILATLMTNCVAGAAVPVSPENAYSEAQYPPPPHETAPYSPYEPPAATQQSQSCFFRFDGRKREFCEAYQENKSCFMAFSRPSDRGWCQHIKEGKTCFMALDGAERNACESGRIPRQHALASGIAPAPPKRRAPPWRRHRAMSKPALPTTGSCFMNLDGRDRELCEAYRENKSCFMAFTSQSDRSWCEHVKEGKSCFMALRGAARRACEAGRIPRDHRPWRYK